MESEEGSLQNF